MTTSQISEARIRTRHVSLVELTVYDNSLPLLSGYLQAYSQKDPAIAQAYDFSFFTRWVRDDHDRMADDLVGANSDVYAFSCYIWNMRLVRKLVAELRERRPEAWIVLGGPQVIRHAETYIPDGDTKVVVCNGEGEQPFYEFLTQLLDEEPDLHRVSTMSFRDPRGKIVSTDPNARLRTLDEIPSPFALGLFDGGGPYTYTTLETNRGCPYNCGFCFWGAATNSKVYSFEEQRVRDDITWIGENSVASVYIADANWGLSPRDIGLSEHMVNCRKRYGFPEQLVITAAKNRPERVAEISEILVRGGVITSQPVSLQTVNEESLRLVDRQNIRSSSYSQLQRTLDEKNISSFIEMIWPMPGETLESFRTGIGTLCRAGANTLTIYPQLLLHNTAMYDRRAEFGIETEPAAEPASEVEVVVATRWVSRADCVEGTWFYYVVQSLFNGRGAYFLGKYLDSQGIQPYEDMFWAATKFWQRHADDHDIARFVAESLSAADNYDLLNIGKVAYLALHSRRAEFDRLLRDFVVRQPWWEDPAARLAHDLDLVARPYIFREPVRTPGVELTEARLLDTGRRDLVIGLPPELAYLPGELGLIPAGQEPAGLRLTHHGRGRMPVPRTRTMHENAGYCHVMIQRLRTLLPECEPLSELPAETLTTA